MGNLVLRRRSLTVVGALLLIAVVPLGPASAAPSTSEVHQEDPIVASGSATRPGWGTVAMEIPPGAEWEIEVNATSRDEASIMAIALLREDHSTLGTCYVRGHGEPFADSLRSWCSAMPYASGWTMGWSGEDTHFFALQYENRGSAPLRLVAVMWAEGALDEWNWGLTGDDLVVSGERTEAGGTRLFTPDDFGVGHGSLAASGSVAATFASPVFATAWSDHPILASMVARGLPAPVRDAALGPAGMYGWDGPAGSVRAAAPERPILDAGAAGTYTFVVEDWTDPAGLQPPYAVVATPTPARFAAG